MIDSDLSNVNGAEASSATLTAVDLDELQPRCPQRGFRAAVHGELAIAALQTGGDSGPRHAQTRRDLREAQAIGGEGQDLKFKRGAQEVATSFPGTAC